MYKYMVRKLGMQILLSNSQAGPGRKVKQEQEEISRNHVQASVCTIRFCHSCASHVAEGTLYFHFLPPLSHFRSPSTFLLKRRERERVNGRFLTQQCRRITSVQGDSGRKLHDPLGMVSSHGVLCTPKKVQYFLVP